MIAMGTQAFNYAGFHAYVQDVAGPSGKAGLLLSVTNTGGVVFGCLGNLLTGALVESTGSFASVFFIAGVFYVISCVSWIKLMTGEQLF